MTSSLDYEDAVSKRYSGAAKQRESALCCPVAYRRELLDAIPIEILERDYGCGDPSPFVTSGDTVLDLGSGGGKLCFIAAQLVGAKGRVIGVDCNEEMLALARGSQAMVADRIGFDNVSFRCGMIQDLQLDLELFAKELKRIDSTAGDVASILKQRQLEQRLRMEQPLVASDSVDCVVSNCVLNLVRPHDRQQLFREVFRVLKPGGRAAICDIVSDENVPLSMQGDSKLWSGCVAGAWREDQFLAEFENAGFHGMRFAKFETEPWRTVEGIEFRSVTVVAYKGKNEPCLERNQAVIYRGPFKQVRDDDGHDFARGERMAVCDKTFKLLQQEPYRDSFVALEPQQTIPLAEAKEFDCRMGFRRNPRQTKGFDYRATIEHRSDCCPDGECC